MLVRYAKLTTEHLASPRRTVLLWALLFLAVIMAPAARASITHHYTSASDTPVSADGYAASGTATLTLGFAPVEGTDLTVVKNTGPAFIDGTFSNLAQGQTVVLTWNGTPYQFVVNYYGATGNDLVLVWKNNRALAWGTNFDAQLGDGTPTQRIVPAAVTTTGVLAGKTIVALAEGRYHSLALCADGTVAAWGNNYYGQLGDDTTKSRNEPVAVNTAAGSALAGKTVIAIAAGGSEVGSHSVALCSDGTVAAWGHNYYGQLGDNSTTQRNVPVAVNTSAGSALAGKTVVAVAAGGLHSVALCSDGTVAAWGYNYLGQLGDNSTTQREVPVAVNTAAGSALVGKTVTAVAAGSAHNIALCADGTVAAWGYNANGQLGDNSTTSPLVPVAVNAAAGSALAGRTVVAVAAGESHSVALCEDGTVAAWGYNGYGQLGDNSTTQRTVPVAVNTAAGSALAGKTVVAVATAGLHTVALCADGTLAAWGLNNEGQLGDNSTTQREVPVAVNTAAGSALAGKTVTAVAAGGFHSMALCADGTVAAWGYNYHRQLGDSMPTERKVPVAVTATGALAGKTIVSLAGGYAHSVALCSDGTVAAWGTNLNGQLGDSTTIRRDVPVAVNTAAGSALAGKTVIAVATGDFHSMALCSDGTVAEWGFNGTGRLSYNTPIDRTVPRAVNTDAGSALAGKTVTAIAAGGHHSVALCSDGTVAAWGDNGSGQLGNNSTTEAEVPVAVNMAAGSALAGKTVVAVAAGGSHSLALCSDGTVAAWGYNTYGQLGDNATSWPMAARSTVPVAVNTAAGSALAGKTVVAVAAGASHSLALCADGTVAAWGDSSRGQLGDNSTLYSRLPVAVNTDAGSALADKTVVAVGAGLAHNVALCSDGTLAAWGWNHDGELGDNSTTQRNVPVAVNSSVLTTGERFSKLFAGPGARPSLALASAPPDTTPPTLSAVMIASSNVNPTRAKAGDEITLSFTASEAIQSPIVTLAGKPATVTNASGNHWTAKITVAANDTQGATAFSVVFTDTGDNSGTTVTAMTNGTSVIIDTTAPTVTPPANQTVTATSANGATVNYPAATASDTLSGPPTIGYSQHTFPLATTTVTVTATDAAGNSATATFTVTVIASKTGLPASAGGDVPGAGEAGSGVPTGAKWRSFGIPGIDDGGPGGDAGVPVFLGTFGTFGTPSANPARPLITTGVFGLGGSTPLLARTGDDAPDTDQATFASFGEPVGNAGTAFIGTVREKTGRIDKATASGIWSNAFPDADGALHLVARLGSPAPDAGVNYKAIDGLALNDGQHLFWTATLTGATDTNRALFLQSTRTGVAHLVLRTGDEIDGFAGVTVKSFIALREGGGGGVVNAAGSGTGRPNGGATTPVLVTFSDKSTAIFNVGLNPYDFLARTGTAAPADITNGVWQTLGLPAAAGDTIAFRAILAPQDGTTDVTRENAAAIYVRTPGHPLAAIVRQGDTPLGTAGPLVGFSDPTVNANGDVIFFATIAAAKKLPGLFIARPQGGTYTLSQLSWAGGDAPDLTGILPASFTGAALPQNFDPTATQGPVFIAKLKSGTEKVNPGEGTALFACDQDGVPHLIARTGPQTSGKPLKTIDALSSVLASPAHSRAAASGSKVIYRATYTDKTQALVEVPVP